MANDSTDPSEDYSRLAYRRFVAWPARIQREGPLLRRILERAPDRSVLDLGCATGEHSRFLASLGLRVVGVDVSAESLRTARESPSPESIRYVEGDLRNLGSLVSPGFGGAICLGNTLVHLVEEDDLAQALEGLASVLNEGGVFLFQILNYERLRGKGIRHLPLNFLDEPDGVRVFLRLMDFLPQGRVRFCPSTLRLRPQEERPLEVLETRSLELRAWGLDELRGLLHRAGFAVTDVLGAMSGQPFVVAESTDLIVVAERRRKS
ncbi:MAG: class I SAM-dependent methyltransferase [Acidobacteriota bacterium]